MTKAGRAELFTATLLSRAFGSKNHRLVIFLSTAVTGATNVLLPLSLQVSGDLTVLGQFAVASIPQGVALAVSRSLGSQTVLRGSRFVDVKHLRLIFGLLLATATILTSLTIWMFDLPTVFSGLILAAPLSVVQDVFRQRAFGIGREERALISDLIWFLCFFSVLCFLLISGASTIEHIILGYTFGALASVAYSLFFWPRQGGPAFGQVAALPLLAEALAIFGIAQVSSLVVATLLPIYVVGEFRSALTALTPVGLFLAFAQSVAIPRLDVRNRAHVQGWALSIFGASLAATALIAALFAAAPGQLRATLGFDTSNQFFVTLSVTGVGMAVGGLVGLVLVRFRVYWATRVWLTVRVSIACVEPFVTIPMALAFGSAGLASNMLTTNGLLLVYSQLKSQLSNRQTRIEVHRE